MRNPRSHQQLQTTYIAPKVRRDENAASNAVRFMSTVEGDFIDAPIRGANGARWRLA